MGFPTTTGRTSAWAGTAFCLFHLLAGCATSQPGQPSLSNPQAAEAHRRVDDVIRETRAEASALRAEMAATRIAAAKKEAELEETRRQVTDLQQTRAQQQRQHQQQMEAKQKELAALQNERDHLLQKQSDFQVQLVELPVLRQAVADAKTLELQVGTRIKELESTVAALAAELAQVKKDLAESLSKSRTKPKASAKATPKSVPPGSP